MKPLPPKSHERLTPPAALQGLPRVQPWPPELCDGPSQKPGKRGGLRQTRPAHEARSQWAAACHEWPTARSLHQQERLGHCPEVAKRRRRASGTPELLPQEANCLATACERVARARIRRLRARGQCQACLRRLAACRLLAAGSAAPTAEPKAAKESRLAPAVPRLRGLAGRGVPPAPGPVPALRWAPGPPSRRAPRPRRPPRR
mmetsp:Transcript_49922/g.154392  ORF Transcript_49922/g.154392 Transcript_49922/m.154392 type:complete len:203 (-) Transcript_49922:84-692(-)